MSLYRKQDGRSSEGVTPAEGIRSGKTTRPAGGPAGGAAKPAETAQVCSERQWRRCAAEAVRLSEKSPTAAGDATRVRRRHTTGGQG